MENNSAPGVKIQSTVKNCRVRDKIVNEGDIKVETDGTNDFVIGDNIIANKAKSITLQTKIEQTQAKTTSTGSVVGSGSKAKVMIGNHVTENDVKENVESRSKISFQQDDRIELSIGEMCDNNDAENVILKPEIKQVTTNAIAATTTATELQADVSSRTNVRDETEWPPIGIYNANPLPGQNVIYEGIGSVTCAGRARNVHSTLNYVGNGKEGMKLTDNKSHSTDKNTIRVNNIGPMNAIKECEEMKNSVNVTIKPEINENP
ncbi:uncharacterized protein LOC119076001 [Bradysia coprophila]|uniref:uncharacterized protein LOC119076001 n=1 Tax=Bradysia coprophila TaxID=38358 RepID=UPI00187DCBFE|nr:uncharacterized protein LOC119076001 [Bradysia coprophila]